MSWRPPGLVRWAKFNAVGAMGIVLQLGMLALLRSGIGINYLFCHWVSGRGGGGAQFSLARAFHMG